MFESFIPSSCKAIRIKKSNFVTSAWFLSSKTLKNKTKFTWNRRKELSKKKR